MGEVRLAQEMRTQPIQPPRVLCGSLPEVSRRIQSLDGILTGRGKKLSGLPQPRQPLPVHQRSRTGLRTQTSAGQEDQTDLVQVPTLTSWWGCLEPCVEGDSEARSECMSIAVNVGICHRRGGQAWTAPIPGSGLSTAKQQCRQVISHFRTPGPPLSHIPGHHWLSPPTLSPP